MKNIPLALRQAKNKLGSDSPWLFLVDLVLVGGPTFNLVANTEDITFQGQDYAAFSFSVQLPKEANKGEIPTVKLQVSNVNRVLQGQLEALNGGLGSMVTLYIVDAGLLTEDYADLTMEFEVLGAVCDDEWVTFSLGWPNPLRRRFPLYRYLALSCRWQFRGVECAYPGGATTCARTLDACKALGNVANFGGEPGLANGGVRFV
jgi:phage-related protein